MAPRKTRSAALIAIGIASMMLIIVTAGAITVSQTLPSTGTITAMSKIRISYEIEALLEGK